MDCIVEELQVPRKYLKPTNCDDRVECIIHKTWLRSLLKHGQLSSFIERESFDEWPQTDQDLGSSWLRGYITVYRKCDDKVIPLPRVRSLFNKNYSDLSFSQLLHYVMQSNHKNLWKEAYKKYAQPYAEKPSDAHITLTDYNTVLREVVIRMYGCPVVNVVDPSLSTGYSKYFEPHRNVLTAACAVETRGCLFLVHVPFVGHTLWDCVMFSPAALEGAYARPLFVIYQLLQALLALHDRNLTAGDVTLADVYLSGDLWVRVMPRLESNLHVQAEPAARPDAAASRRTPLRGLATAEVAPTGDLRRLCELWVAGRLSNFAYLTALNEASGRRRGEPDNHHVFPWVTEFGARAGGCWRDLTKSKFRLNKGDRQLDLTYENSHVAHHVSDVLSAITYYVYMARRTPRAVLCRHVRSVWVPAEYPSSVQRLQEWTPDECIPEFFCDPSVFKSVHEDLCDLELPPWSSSPEDFVDKHREALESAHVSERLHHWIDLTFGYKLSGAAAVKSKNVCLQLVDGHKGLTNCGVVQLFTQPHPAREVVTPFNGKTPPKIHVLRQKLRDRSNSSLNSETQRQSEDEDISSGVEDDGAANLQTPGRPPLALSRLLSRSRTSLNAEEPRPGEPGACQKTPKPAHKTSPSLGPKYPTFTSHIQKTSPSNPSAQAGAHSITVQRSSPQAGVVFLPKEYNPAAPLAAVEAFHGFLAKTFPGGGTEWRGARGQPPAAAAAPSSYKQIVASCRVRELQVLGCLIVEIFLARQLRPRGCARLPFSERLALDLDVLRQHGDALPHCVRSAARLLLQPDEPGARYPAVTELGLPPPSAHQLLQPLLGCVFPFPPQLPRAYVLLAGLQEFADVAAELDVLFHFDCDGEHCARFEGTERTRLLLAQSVAECRVKFCGRALEPVLEGPLVDLVLPYVRRLIQEPCTSVLAAWYLFDPVARALGPRRAARSLLHCLLRLYEADPPDLDPCVRSKVAKLYHHSFLLRLVVRLGLRTFLDNFVTPLVEAVGGGKDADRSDAALHDHGHRRLTRKTSNLRTVDHGVAGAPGAELDTLSPFDEEESSGDSDRSALAATEPEVFEFESEERAAGGSPDLADLAALEQLQLSTDLRFSHSTAEEAVEDGASDRDDPEDGADCPRSPTITIPSAGQHADLVTIGCDVGSKSRDADYFEKPSGAARRPEPEPEGPERRRRGCNISDMSADSLVWLAHRLGPVLTARHLTRNLLRMLTLCYDGPDNLQPLAAGAEPRPDGVDAVSIGRWRVAGDLHACKVLHCLVSMAALYGEQLILLQYLPHVGELIASCKRRLTANLEGGLIGCFALLKHTIPYLVDATLMDQLQDVILRNILHPAARLLSSTKYLFPNGAAARNVLARKYLDALYVLALRIGADLTRTHLAVPALQRFFFAFTKVHGDPEISAYKPSPLPDGLAALSDEHYVEVRRDGTVAEWAVRGQPPQVSQLRARDSDSTDSFSPPPSFLNEPELADSVSYRAMEELRQVFNADLAHAAFVPFLHYIGEQSMEQSLKNYALIRDLCHECQRGGRPAAGGPSSEPLAAPSGTQDVCVGSTGSFGSNVALIGNRIDVQVEGPGGRQSSVLSLVSNRMENTNRHLRGNWLAYWEHEIGRADKDTMFNFKQIKLQSFSGHTNAVKAIQVLDNENSFMTGSKDKTVKLWSLRSQGDGSAVSQCQSTYTGHKKSVTSVTFLESLRYTASCDSVVHIWDPFLGSVISQLEGPRVVPVSMLRPMPAPSAVLLAATDTTVRLIDARTCSYIHEFKVALNPIGLIRCLSVSPCGTWVAAGQSSGNVVVLDVRTGLVVSAWKAHDGEILQLLPVDGSTLISSSLDQAISVWSVADGKLKFNMKGATEPVHCLNMYNAELISGTTANRVGVHTSVDVDASFSSTRLRSDTFRGVLTSMAVLPLNRLLLLGADSGSVSLLC